VRTDSGGAVVTDNAFGYNLRSEVTSAAMGTNAYAYVYDPIGNRVLSAMTAADTVTNLYAANALNQYSCITNSAFSASPREIFPVYDPDGNMLTNGPWAYTWDAENRMTAAVSNNVLLVCNTYDHQSRRIRKEVYSRASPSTAYEQPRDR
jgi:YD repeat-containing protein